MLTDDKNDLGEDKSNQTIITFSIPENLNLEALILAQDTIRLNRRTTVNGKRLKRQVDVKTKSLLKHIPYCYYLIDLIVTRASDQRDSFKGYVNLQSELLDQVIPHQSRIMIIDLLEILKVLEVNSAYSVGNYSKSYRLTERFRSSSCNQLTFCYDREKKGYNIWGLGSINTSYVESFLKRVRRVKLGEKKLRDHERSQDTRTLGLISRYMEYKFQQEQVRFNIYVDREEIARDNLKDDPLTRFIRKIDTGEHSINLRNKVDRVFSPITTLCKEFRKYLRCKQNKKLLLIDFQTSHVFHLLKTIRESGTNDPDLLDEAEKLKQIALIDAYVYVQKQFEIAHGTQITRDYAKDLFLKNFIGGMYPNRKASRWINSLFPLTAKFVDEQGRKTLSILLLKSEACLLNNFIFKRIAEESDESITVFGIFDGVFVDENHFDQVYNIMLEESEKYFGYEVPIKVPDTLT